MMSMNTVGGWWREALSLSGVWAGVREGFTEEALTHAQFGAHVASYMGGRVCGVRVRGGGILFGYSLCPSQSRAVCEHTRPQRALGTSVAAPVSRSSYLWV